MVMFIHSFAQLQSANRSIASIALGLSTHWSTFYEQCHKSIWLAQFQSMRKGSDWWPSMPPSRYASKELLTALGAIGKADILGVSEPGPLIR